MNDVTSEELRTRLLASSGQTIHQLMAAVMADMVPVGKDQENRQQGFKFRGIEQVIAAVRAAMIKHGVYFVPSVLARETETRATGGGKPMNVVHLWMKYTFYGPSGDSVEAQAWGEGADLADKATSKAMSMALKYALVETFCVVGEHLEDSDAAGEEAGPPNLAYAGVVAAMEALDSTEAARALYREVTGLAAHGSLSAPQAKWLQDQIVARQSALGGTEDSVERS